MFNMMPRPTPRATKKKVVAPFTSGPNLGVKINASTAKITGKINFFITVVTSFHTYYFSGLDKKIDNLQMVIC